MRFPFELDRQAAQALLALSGSFGVCADAWLPPAGGLSRKMVGPISREVLQSAKNHFRMASAWLFKAFFFFPHGFRIAISRVSAFVATVIPRRDNI